MSGGRGTVDATCTTCRQVFPVTPPVWGDALHCPDCWDAQYAAVGLTRPPDAGFPYGYRLEPWDGQPHRFTEGEPASREHVHHRLYDASVEDQEQP